MESSHCVLRQSRWKMWRQIYDETYSSKSASWKVRGAYKRLCFARNSKKAPTRIPETTIHGTSVEYKADTDDELLRWLPDREDALGEDMVRDVEDVNEATKRGCRVQCVVLAGRAAFDVSALVTPFP